MKNHPNGYEIIELPVPSDKVKARVPIELELALCFWHVNQINSGMQLPPGIEVDLIKVEYYGAYPAIGVKYNGNDSISISEAIISFIESASQDTTLNEFTNFVFEHAQEINNEILRWKTNS